MKIHVHSIFQNMGEDHVTEWIRQSLEFGPLSQLPKQKVLDFAAGYPVAVLRPLGAEVYEGEPPMILTTIKLQKNNCDHVAVPTMFAVSPMGGHDVTSWHCRKCNVVLKPRWEEESP
jgi:hypothetical protein